MGSKTKGTNAERQLIHLLWDHGFAATRIAGSGSSHYPSADIIAGKPDKKYIIECKVTKKDAKYFPDQEILQLVEFSERFGAIPLIAIRFFRTEWFFLNPSSLRTTSSSFVVDKETAEKKGITIDAL